MTERDTGPEDLRGTSTGFSGRHGEEWWRAETGFDGLPLKIRERLQQIAEGIFKRL